MLYASLREDNPLAKARELSTRTDAHTIQYPALRRIQCEYTALHRDALKQNISWNE